MCERTTCRAAKIDGGPFSDDDCQTIVANLVRPNRQIPVGSPPDRPTYCPMKQTALRRIVLALRLLPSLRGGLRSKATMKRPVALALALASKAASRSTCHSHRPTSCSRLCTSCADVARADHRLLCIDIPIPSPMDYNRGPTNS